MLSSTPFLFQGRGPAFELKHRTITLDSPFNCRESNSHDAHQSCQDQDSAGLRGALEYSSSRFSEFVPGVRIRRRDQSGPSVELRGVEPLTS